MEVSNLTTRSCLLWLLQLVHDNIDKFIDWIEPYIDKEGEDLACIGWRWFEDDQKPELIFV